MDLAVQVQSLLEAKSSQMGYECNNMKKFKKQAKQSFNNKDGRGRWSWVPWGWTEKKNRIKIREKNKNNCASDAPSLSSYVSKTYVHNCSRRHS